MSTPNFAHLHNHTMFSILDATNKISECIARVKELGMTACAITDHGNMFGVIDFYKEAKKAGIKPILGCEVYVTDKSRFEKEPTKHGDRYYHMVLLAENNTGYSNLVKIVSAGYKDGFYYKPRIDREVLEKYSEGIIALSACVAGEVPKAILRNDLEEAREIALYYKDLFGENNFFLELQDHGIKEERIVNMELIRISKELNIPLVVTNDCHYTYQDDYVAHDVLLCIEQQKLITDTNRMSYDGDSFYIKSEEEMRELFPYALEAVENTQKIADRCDVEIVFHETKMPKFDVPDGYDTFTYLRKLCYDGLEKRYSDADNNIKEQLDYELKVIKDMGYIEYFLIVWDFINWARENDVSVGPGRGSAAGSLVSYTTGITNIDPLKYALLFERFLNPERVSMPDIDIDFCMQDRYKVIEYVSEKYGEDCVCQIITFGTMAARQVIKDVGKAMGMPYAETNKIASMIPKEVGITITKALEMNPEFSALYESETDMKQLIDMSIKLEGLPRQTGIHAAGVIISDRPITDYIPIALNSEGNGYVSQFTMTTVEELGHLKMDFLGLRTLTAIRYAVEDIKRTHGIDIDIDAIDYDDKEVLKFIGTGNTNGVFQLESDGMKGFMKELKPQNIEDLIAGISLYRPGPMDFIPKYIKGKNNPEEIAYDCPEMESILAPTYGTIVYQEQVMQIVRDLGGYTLGRSDLVRRAMSKKKMSVMAEERKNFVYGNIDENIPGCVNKGISQKIANKIYDDMIDFAKYAFNKSHAAAYAVVSYQTAWLKYYYPTEYMAAVMTSEIDKKDKLIGHIASCDKVGISIVRPDINKSQAGFSVASENVIRFALAGVAKISMETAKKICEIRGNGFSSFTDAVFRLSEAGVNKSAIGNLIKAGAFDNFDGNRNQFLSVHSEAISKKAKQDKKVCDGQLDLFALCGMETPEISLPDVSEFSFSELLELENEACGIYLSGNPLDGYRSFIQSTSNIVSGMEGSRNGIFCGQITEMKKVYTKNQKIMAFLKVMDLYGTIDVVVFPKTYDSCQNKLQEGERLVFIGQYSNEDEKEASLACQKVFLFSEVPVNLWVRFGSIEEFEQKKTDLFQLMETVNRGRDDVYVIAGKKYMALSGYVLKEEETVKRFVEMFGAENVAIKVPKEFFL